ncbi:3864_t:CDS:2 [Racocetra fulgida]|uniref:3864_t:CDS:1 n=1 Tax=Racocetra fulgida TaxID=60492 RepID=A0A9N8ZVB2_9GLOM|nr:3864_t:CDS:2 [Racocetra fulgida]
MSTEDKQDDHNAQINITSAPNSSGLLSESTEHPGLEFVTPDAVEKNMLGDNPVVSETIEDLTARGKTHASESSLHLKDSQFKAKLFVNTSSSILALTVLALVTPAAFRMAAAPQVGNIPKNIDCDLQIISHATAIILMTIFIGSLVFQLKTHVQDVRIYFLLLLKVLCYSMIFMSFHLILFDS